MIFWLPYLEKKALYFKKAGEMLAFWTENHGKLLIFLTKSWRNHGESVMPKFMNISV